MRVLVADDDVTSRLVLTSVAARQGHDCVVAEDGSTAWDLLTSEGIHVLLTDWMMPGVDGLELCRRVRGEIKDRYVYIVLITGRGHPEQILEGMSAGADDYLVKPVDPFAVRTRLVAAERVTALHRQVAQFRAELEQANLELLGLSITDALTGLGNRRRMEEDLTRTHERAIQLGRGYAVVLFDVDHFKLFNDHYGHGAGDEALRLVAGCLDQTTGAGATVYRYGGEEFLVLMPDCTVGSAVVAANRIAEAVSRRAIGHEARPDLPRIITVSGGVAGGTPAAGLTAARTVELADRALYEAKARGRNRVHPVLTEGSAEGDLLATVG